MRPFKLRSDGCRSKYWSGSSDLGCLEGGVEVALSHPGLVEPALRAEGLVDDSDGKVMRR